MLPPRVSVNYTPACVVWDSAVPKASGGQLEARCSGESSGQLSSQRPAELGSLSAHSGDASFPLWILVSIKRWILRISLS